MGALAELIKLGIKTASKQADEVVPKAMSKVDDISVFPKPQKMFPEDARPAGGEYLNPATQDILTGKNFSKGNISITPEGRPSFKVSPSEKEIVGSPDIKGATQIKTNLFKKKAGWKWDKAPKGYEDAPTLVSVENKGKHYYTLDAQFPEGVNLSRYAKSKTEPRLRPTIKGFVELGKPIGKISVRGKEHPVYDKIINREEGGQVLPVIKKNIGGQALEGLDGEYMRKRNSKEKLEGMIGIQSRQYGGGLDDAYMNRRRSSAFAAPDATSAFASPMSMGGLPTIYRDVGGTADPGQGGDFNTTDEEDSYSDEGIGYNFNDGNTSSDYFTDPGLEQGLSGVTPSAPSPYEEPDPDAGAGWGFGVGAPGISRTDPNQTFEDVLDNIPAELGQEYYTRQLNKEGFPEWTWPYYNSLKARGMTNDEATSMLAAAMATPGGLSGMQSAYGSGYSYGGPLGTMGDLLEKGMASRVNINNLLKQAEYRKKYEEDFEKSQLSGFELGKAGLKGIASDVADMFSLRSNLKDDPFIMDKIESKFTEAGLNFTPASGAMGTLMNFLVPSVAKGLSNLTGAGRTIGTVTDPKTGQSFNVSDTGKFSLNLDPAEVDYGNDPKTVRKRKPIQKAVASTTEEKPKEGIAGYYERLDKSRPATSRVASNKYIEDLLKDLYPDPRNRPTLG